MPIIELKGDLLESDCNVIIHCCNCFHVMGAGIAKAIVKKWPDVLRADKQTVHGKESKLGTISVSKTDGVTVFNLYGQFYYGRGVRNLNYEALYNGLVAVKVFIAKNPSSFQGVKIGTYPLGCGLAGGNWKIVKPIIEEIFHDTDIYVYTL